MSKLALLGGRPVREKPFARWPVFDESERDALIEVLNSGVWSGYNPAIAQFEAAFAAFHRTRYAAAASNGTVTLEAALQAAGIGPGDEVIVPSITFIATATSVVRVGAIPVFADIGPDHNLSPESVREAISERTRALIVVHFAGRPADMDVIHEIAAAHSLVVIEDAAHAHGAIWRDLPVGNWSDLASFSFQQSKNLTAGEGGILTGNNRTLIETARSIFNQGRLPSGAWYEHETLGTNQRLTAWQAAILLEQLKRLPAQLERRAASAAILDRALGALPFVELAAPDARVTRHSHYLYVIRLRMDDLPGVSHSLFLSALTAEGVPGVGCYPHPIYANNVFRRHEHRQVPAPLAERFCRENFWVSHEIMLADPADLEDFVAAIAKVAANAEELLAATGR